MVHREPDPRRRLQHYVIADDVWVKAWQVSARTNLNWAETAAEARTSSAATPPPANA